MSYKLSQFMTAVNSALNYPAITYDDVALFIDQCVAEINTTLHTSLRSVRECVEYGRLYAISENATANIPEDPRGAGAQVPVTESLDEPHLGKWQYWVVNDERYRKYVYVDDSGNVTKVRDRLFGVYVDDGIPKLHEAHAYSDALCLWIPTEGPEDLDLSDYLTEDWIALFAIPYVCFKYTVRDGGAASTFAEEMEQGFQQLQEAYDVPSKVFLAKVAGMPAYRKDVKERLDAGLTLNVETPTRAIVDSMKHPRAVGGRFGSVFDAGGWGL